VPLRQHAVLFRSGHHSDALEVELGRRNIPFVKFGGLRFLEAAHVEDALSCLRWAENPRDSLAAFRVAQLLPGMGFFIRQQSRHGDRHVFTPRTRFIPDAILDKFERAAPGTPADDRLAPSPPVARVDIAARLKASWATPKLAAP
jgi:superfamily I DNA/RNA helicase